MSDPGERDVVVVAASVAFDGPRLSEQHLSLALAAAGHRVLYLDPVRPSWTRAGGLASRRPVSWSVAEVAPRLTRATFGVPPGLRGPRLIPALDRLRSAAARRLLRRRGQRAAAVLSAASRPSVFAGFPGARCIFWAKDDYIAGADLIGRDATQIAAGQAALATTLTAVVAVSADLRDLWTARVPRVAVIPAGSDPDMAAAVLAAPPPSDVALPRPIAGFVGQISERIDLGLLEAVADTGASLLLVGPKQLTFGGHDRFDALVARRNVCWTGAVRYDLLPSYLGAIEVGLIPYTDSAFNRASFPLKLLEYLSAGAGVVSTDLPAARWLGSPEITVSGAGRFAEDVLRRLAQADADPGRRDRRRNEAAAHSWSRRAESFAEVLGLQPLRLQSS